jgi:hypothetical protein
VRHGGRDTAFLGVATRRAYSHITWAASSRSLSSPHRSVAREGDETAPFAAATLSSRHLRAPFTCSSASETVARSRARPISLPPAPSTPINVAGTWWSRNRASGRVGSMTAICETVTPGAAFSTANRDGPAVLRAMTNSMSAVPA